MDLKSTEITHLEFVSRGFWIGKVLFKIEENERFHNISAEVRLEGNKEQKFSEIEELLIQKAKSALLLAGNSQ